MNPLRPHVVNIISSRTRRARRLAATGSLMLSAFVMSALAVAASADDRPVESMSLNFARPFANGLGSRVTSIVDLWQSPARLDVWEHAISGTAEEAPGRWVPVFWLCNNETISGPFKLLANGRRGRTNDLTVDPSNPNVVYFTGTVFDDTSISQAAMWTVNLDTYMADQSGNALGGVAFLPFPGQFSGGVRVATGDINGDGLSDIIVGGTTTTGLLVPAIQKIRLWTHLGGTPGYSHFDLPVANENGDADITGLAVELENVAVTGYSFTQDGRQQATLWQLRHQDLEVENDETHWVGHRTFLPGGSPSQARTETVDNNETIAVGGTRTNATGKTLPAIWLANSSRATWQGRNLPLPDGFNGGRVNGIIAILIGLLVPGDVSHPNGQSAAIWHIDALGNASVVDLNTIQSNLPDGAHLNSVQSILPYMEQESLFKIIGSATGPRGTPLGYVGTILGHGVSYTDR